MNSLPISQPWFSLHFFLLLLLNDKTRCKKESHGGDLSEFKLCSPSFSPWLNWLYISEEEKFIRQ